MQLDIPRACDVNVSLQRRLHEDMDTCAFTARERVVDAAPAIASSAPHYERRDAADETRGWQERQTVPSTNTTGGFSRWAMVLALAVAFLAFAYLHSKWAVFEALCLWCVK